MKASEFIRKTTELIEIYGDLEMRISDDPVPESRADVVYENPRCSSPFFEVG